LYSTSLILKFQFISNFAVGNTVAIPILNHVLKIFVLSVIHCIPSQNGVAHVIHACKNHVAHIAPVLPWIHWGPVAQVFPSIQLEPVAHVGHCKPVSHVSHFAHVGHCGPVSHVSHFAHWIFHQFQIHVPFAHEYCK